MSSGVTTMSKRTAVGEIINGPQAVLLDVLREAARCLSRMELLDASGQSRTMLNRHLLELVECELVDVAKASEAPDRRAEHWGRTALLYTVTRAGCRALARYEHKQAEADKVLVAPQQNNMFTRPDYVPASRAFYRNAGNKHIQSRGFPC